MKELTETIDLLLEQLKNKELGTEWLKQALIERTKELYKLKQEVQNFRKGIK